MLRLALIFACFSFASSSSTHILQKILINYDKSDLPTPWPVDVQLELTVEDIKEISQTDGSFDADVRFTQIWRDSNLNFAHIDAERSNITLDSTVLNSIWTPNVCFVNSKRTRTHVSPAPNILLLISPNGTVWVNYRVNVEGTCDMDMANFPMDIQRCKLIFESYSYNAAEVQLRWIQGEAIKLAQHYQIPEFVLVGVEPERNELLYTAGTWDQLVVKFTFKRKLGYYMLQAYLPTHVCVAVSWVSFYLDTNATPARASVGVSTLMALLLSYGNIASGLPRVSYLRALDVWMGACMMLTFAALLEFAVVGFVEKRRLIIIGQSTDDAKPVLTWAWINLNTFGSTLDSISAKAFPAAFFIFNLAYWIYYLYSYFTLA